MLYHTQIGRWNWEFKSNFPNNPCIPAHHPIVLRCDLDETEILWRNFAPNKKLSIRIYSGCKNFSSTSFRRYFTSHPINLLYAYCMRVCSHFVQHFYDTVLVYFIALSEFCCFKNCGVRAVWWQKNRSINLRSVYFIILHHLRSFIFVFYLLSIYYSTPTLSFSHSQPVSLLNPWFYSL